MRKVILIVIISLLTACGVKIQGIEIDRVVSAISSVGDLGAKDQEEEIEIGQETSRSLLDKTQLANDQTIQRYVNQVGYWLVRHTSRADLPWRFVVINDPSINAFAAPGGNIFITTGMVGSLTSEAELAGVLAHEIAHVLQRHHLVALQGKAQRGLVSDLAMLGVQSQQAKHYADNQKSNETNVSSAFERSVQTLYERGLDRTDEMEADRIGIQLAAKAGYDPYAFINVLQVIQSRESGNHRELKRFVKTHPSAEQRLSELEPTLIKLEKYELEMKLLSERFVANTQY